MRRLQRLGLNATSTRYLAKRAGLITAASLAQRKMIAQTTYANSRQTKAFASVLSNLKQASGAGLLCMYCSSNEASHVEHFWPVDAYPDKALSYDNFLWACSICNTSYKGTSFPLDANNNPQLINPFDDNVWDYFFIDETFGRLLPRFSSAGNPNFRAIVTQTTVGISRENLQIRRQNRFCEMKSQFGASLQEYGQGIVDEGVLFNLVQRWRQDVFQADVGDYFLNGPGQSVEPFFSVLNILALT